MAEVIEPATEAFVRVEAPPLGRRTSRAGSASPIAILTILGAGVMAVFVALRGRDDGEPGTAKVAETGWAGGRGSRVGSIEVVRVGIFDGVPKSVIFFWVAAPF